MHVYIIMVVSDQALAFLSFMSQDFSFFCRLSYFDVYTDSGTIYVKNGNLLDREGTSSYSPTLQARDSGNNVGSTVLEITILDINDQTPQFYRDYEVFIRENNVLNLQVEVRCMSMSHEWSS